MGGVNVKITMIERLLLTVAPHPCSGCPKIGTILCHDCKYDIIHEPFMGCILCGTPEKSGICASHHSPISKSFTISTRNGALEHTINRLKFENTKQAAKTLAGLMHDALPDLPSDILLVPIPTVTSHIRQRGYDHIDLIARHFLKLRPLPIQRALIRKTSTTQHIANKEDRKLQATHAFGLVAGASFKDTTVLLLDDVVTTGSTLQAAAKLLSEAGATVWSATLAYQPLD